MKFFSPAKRICTFTFLCSVLSAAHTPARPAEANTPFVRIGESTITPVIDGKLNDPAWAHSITISDFTATGTKKPVAEQTQVKMAYDEEKLYFAWHCQESLLTVAQQRVHEVRANARNRDGDVFSDDNVILFLQPNGSNATYEFNLNSVGTLFDAASQADDLWGARNPIWNSAAQAAAVQEDGFWTAELAIPWKAFGLANAPTSGTSWNLGLARRAVGRGESSAWNYHESPAIHLVSQWGQIVFDTAVPGITAKPLPSFEAGKSHLSVQLANAPSAVTIEGHVVENNKPTRFQQTAPSAQQTPTLTVPISANSDALLWQWTATGSSGSLLYRSPQLSISAQSIQAKLKLSTTASWKLYINQALVSQGPSASNQEITFSLEQGVNDVIVETQSGTAQLDILSSPASLQKAASWRTAPVNVDKKSERNNWALAPVKDGIIGTPGAPALLQHTLLLKSTPHYPVTEPAFYIAQGTTQQLLFIAEGVEGIRFDDWNVMIAVPQEVEVVGSSGLYGKYIAGKAEFHTTPAGETTIDGQRLRLYRVAANKPLIHKKDQQPLLITLEALLRLRQGQQHDSSKEWPLYYWTVGNKGAVSEMPQSFRLRTAPPPRGKQPQKFVWEFWTSGTHVYDDRELLRNILDTSRQAGFNKYLASGWKDFNDMVRGYGMKTFALLMFKDGRTFDLVRPHLVKYPEERMIDKTGKPLADYMCTTQLHGKHWPMFAKSIQEWMLKADLDTVEYDYEYPPSNPPHACFCERCLVAFRTFARLDTKTELTPESVQKNYAPQWVDFMAYRTAMLLGKIKAAVHEANPKVKFTSYSGYYDAKENSTKSRYGIDWDVVGRMQAVDEVGMGYGRPMPAITDSIAALRGIPVKYGELLVPYDIRSRRPVAPLKKAVLLRRALDATGGVLIYERKSMDGRSWYAVGEITRLTADFEELFLNQRPVTLAGQKTDQIQVVKGKQHSLVCVLNESSKALEYNFQLPAELDKGYEYYSGKTVAAGQAITLTLEPGEVAVYVLQP